MDVKLEGYVKKATKHALRASGRYSRSGIPWRSDQTFRLIEMYQSMPCLWDWKCEAYKDRKLKHDARQTMANELGVDIYEVEKKLHSLKSQFRREHKKMRVARKNGRAVKECAWFGYEPLMFLLQADGPGGTWSADDQNHRGVKMEADNVCSDNGYDDCVELASEEPEETPDFPNQYGRIPSTCVSSSACKRKEIPNGRISEAYNLVETMVDYETKRDEYSVYGEHVGNKLRNCGRSRHDVAVAQHKIDEVLFRLEMGMFSKHNYHTNPSESPSPSLDRSNSPLSHVDFLPVESVLEDPTVVD